jgi:hypothetical protein
MTTILNAPTRRDVKALTDDLASLGVGDIVSITFRTERYGTYRVSGIAMESGVYDALVVAGEPLGVGSRPSTSVVDIDMETIDLGSHVNENVSPLDVVHGDVVSVLFHVLPYGDFVITGHAVALGDSSLMVGGWLVRASGGPGLAVCTVERHEANSSASPVPAQADIEVGS